MDGILRVTGKLTIIWDPRLMSKWYKFTLAWTNMSCYENICLARARNVREAVDLLSVNSKTMPQLATKGEFLSFKEPKAWRFLSEAMKECSAVRKATLRKESGDS